MRDVKKNVDVEEKSGLVPKVSVIIPVYNGKKYMDKCLKSVQKQTLKDIEIICVDDGSTDNTLSILTDYADKDPRIKVYSQKNAGAGAARNVGLSTAKGEYVTFVDSDDWVEPEMYRCLYEKAVKEQSDMVISGQVKLLDDKTHYFTDADTMYLMEDGPFTAEEFPILFNSCFLWNRLYRRGFLDEIGFKIPEGRKFAEDLLPCAQTSVCAKRISMVSQGFYTYNIHDGSLTDTLNKSKDKTGFLVGIAETKEMLCEKGVYPIFQKDFLVFVMNIAFPLLDSNKNSIYNKRFLNGLCEILDVSDFKILKKQGYDNVYPKTFQAMSKRIIRSDKKENK